MATAFAPAALASEEAGGTPVEGLVEVKKGAFQSTWVNPEVDFRQYDKLVIAQEGVVEYRDVGPAKRSRSTMLRSNQREFGMREADRERFEQRASESFSKQLARSKKFEVIDAADLERLEPGSLILRGHLLDVVSHVPPPMIGSGAVYSNQFGEATLVLELIDPASGQVVAVAMERSRIQRSGNNDVYSMMESNSVTALAEVSRWAGRAGSRLAKELDAAHKV